MAGTDEFATYKYISDFLNENKSQSDEFPTKKNICDTYVTVAKPPSLPNLDAYKDDEFVMQKDIALGLLDINIVDRTGGTISFVYNGTTYTAANTPVKVLAGTVLTVKTSTSVDKVMWDSGATGTSYQHTVLAPATISADYYVFRVSTTSHTITPEAKANSLGTIVTSTKNGSFLDYSLTDNASWGNVSHSSGAVTFTAQTNINDTQNTSSRTATLTYTQPTSGLTRSGTVYQQACTYTWYFSATKTSFSSTYGAAGNQSAGITSYRTTMWDTTNKGNQTLTYSGSSNQTWARLSGQNAVWDAWSAVNQPNRTATITITQEKSNRKITLTITQQSHTEGYTYYLTVTGAKSYSYGAGGTFSVVTASYKRKEWDGVLETTQIAVSYTNASNNTACATVSGNTVTVNAWSQVNGSARTAVITATQAESGKTATVTITQNPHQNVYGDYVISVSPTTWSCAVEGGSKTFTITSYRPHTVDGSTTNESVGWTSSASGTGLSVSNATATWADHRETLSTVARSGTITFKQNNSNKTATVSTTQSGRDVYFSYTVYSNCNSGTAYLKNGSTTVSSKTISGGSASFSIKDGNSSYTVSITGGTPSNTTVTGSTTTEYDTDSGTDYSTDYGYDTDYDYQNVTSPLSDSSTDYTFSGAGGSHSYPAGGGTATTSVTSYRRDGTRSGTRTQPQVRTRSMSRSRSKSTPWTRSMSRSKTEILWRTYTAPGTGTVNRNSSVTLNYTYSDSHHDWSYGSWRYGSKSYGTPSYGSWSSWSYGSWSRWSNNGSASNSWGSWSYSYTRMSVSFSNPSWISASTSATGSGTSTRYSITYTASSNTSTSSRSGSSTLTQSGSNKKLSSSHSQAGKVETGTVKFVDSNTITIGASGGTFSKGIVYSNPNVKGAGVTSS